MTRRRWLVLVGLLLVAWGAIAAVLLLGAASDVRDAKQEAVAARRELDADAVVDGAALPRLRKARDGFASARRSIGHPLLAPARLLPVVGRQLRSVRALASSAEVAMDASADAAADLREAFSVAPADGPARLVQLRRVAETLKRTSARLEAADDLGPDAGLLPPIADARDELALELFRARRLVRRAAAGSSAAVELLTGPRQYLLVAANNAEMRAGSGMWLTGGLLRTDQGRFELDEVAPLYLTSDPPDDTVAVEDADLRDRWKPIWPISDDWRSLMTSPRFPAASELAAAMWRASGREEVLDGILLVDPIGLAEIMRATGAVDIAGGRFDASSIRPFLLNGQYRAFDARLAARRDAEAEVAQKVFEALDEGRWGTAELAEALSRAAAGRHLLGWSARPKEQAGFVAATIDGNTAPNSLLVSVLNRGGNKLDYFLRTSVDLALTPAGAQTRGSLKVRLHNGAPSDQPRVVSGPPPDGTWGVGEYVGVVSVTVPGPATEVRIDGRPVVVLGRDGPAAVVGAEVRIPRGGTEEVVVTFSLPVRHGVLRIEPSARHPATRWRYRDTAWEDRTLRTAKF